MTEAEWLKCDRPQVILKFLHRKGRGRKLRLLSCACCRSVPQVTADKEFHRAIETAERFADGGCTADELEACNYDLWDLVRDTRYGYSGRDLPLGVDYALLAMTDLDRPVEWAARFNNGRVRQRLHDLFGNPFRPVRLAPDLFTPAVSSLAQAAYDERLLPGGELDPERLGVLADALEEAGAGEDVMGHLREKGPHVRGCWAVDLCLGKQ
jgi:hypothetical protein